MTDWSPADGWPLISLMLGAPWVGVRKRWPDTLHAVTVDGLPISTWPRGKVASACGLTGLRLLAVDGPILWPPRVRGLPDGWKRCADCQEATGRRRPRSEFVAR